MTDTITLKEHFERILDEKDKANNQRFAAQEKAIQTQDHNRDVAINKAETSIEKKSDAVYVKLTDLQKALTEVMLRPEIEARLKGLTEKVEDIKTSRDKGEGKMDGGKAMVEIIKTIIVIAGFLITFFVLKK